MDIVERILNEAKANKAIVYLSFMVFMELYYITFQKKGEDSTRKLILTTKSLPVVMVESNESLILTAGKLKAIYKISVADSIIGATAINEGAVLVHKDPEFDPLAKEVKLLPLPYK